MTLSGLRVLLAEDNPTNQLVASQMLESLGASVVVAEDGAEALEWVGRESFDVILVDIEMPRVNGIEVIRRVRGSSDPLADIPMIALTAYVMREHRAAIDAAGADGIIAKPILSIEQFGVDIRRFMRKRGAAPDGGAGRDPAGVEAPTEGSDAAESSVVDRTIYDSLAETIGAAAMSELLGKVDSDLTAAHARLARALDPADVAEIRAVTHILISIAGAMGAVALQEQARRMNETAHHGKTGDPGTGGPAVLATIERVLAFVRAQAGG